MKKSLFRQLYATDGEVTVVGKVEEAIEEPKVVEEKVEKKEVKKKNGRKFTI